MGDLTRNFSRKEFECKCGCGAGNINPDHVKRLQQFRDYLENKTGEEYKIIVHSAVRCPQHNKSIGSKATSQHTWQANASNNRPCATDIHAETREGIKMTSICLFDLAIEFGEFSGIGFYKTFIHVDSRQGRKARWKTK